MNWSIFITFVATPRLLLISRTANRSARHSTRGRGAVCAYANISDELDEAGYSNSDIARIKQQQHHYLKVREIVRPRQRRIAGYESLRS